MTSTKPPPRTTKKDPNCMALSHRIRTIYQASMFCIFVQREFYQFCERQKIMLVFD